MTECTHSAQAGREAAAGLIRDHPGTTAVLALNEFVALGLMSGLIRLGRAVPADVSVLSVAAASVVAKVTRDALMAEEAEHFPAYGFDSNRGYPSPVHKHALAGYGPCAIHRRSWIFMDYSPWSGMKRYTGSGQE